MTDTEKLREQFEASAARDCADAIRAGAKERDE